MSYSDFTIEDLRQKLNLRIVSDSGHFASVPPLIVSEWLKETLKKGAPLGVAIRTAKAKSELIVAPVLLEALEHVKPDASLFSGIDFTVDPDRGLKGNIDFLLSRSPEQYSLEGPVVTVVEAKRDDMSAGLAQCVAEMYAARLFNRQRQKAVEAIYGAITVGSGWMFARLIGDEVFHDIDEYGLRDVDRIVGILVAMLKGQC